MLSNPVVLPVSVARDLPGTLDDLVARGAGRGAAPARTSRANTASGGAVESMQDALMEMTKKPPLRRKYCAFRPTMRAWSGCATSAKTTSTMGTSMRYFCGCRASSMIGMTFGRFLAMLTRSRPARGAPLSAALRFDASGAAAIGACVCLHVCLHEAFPGRPATKAA